MPKLCNCSGKLKKQWFVYYSVRDPKTGKMHRFRHYDGFAGLNELQRYQHAQAVIEDYTTKLKTGWTPFTDDQTVIYDSHLDYKTVADMYGKRRAGNRTLRVILSRYLEFKKSGLSRASIDTYTSQLRIFTFWTEKNGLQENDVSAYSNVIILGFFDYLINEKKLCKKTIRKYTELLTSFFNFCITKRYIKKNPVFGIPKCSRINDQAPRPIMRADVEDFKKEIIKDPELYLAIQLEYYCALRPGHEIREMRLKEIDLVSGIIHVDASRAKNRTARIVTIPRQFLLILRQVFENWINAGVRMDREFYVLGRKGIPGPVPLSKNHLGRKFNAIRKKLNMPTEYKLYSWKHTAAVELDQNKIPMLDTSRHFGHGSISMTNKYMENKKPYLSKPIRDSYPDL